MLPSPFKILSRVPSRRFFSTSKPFRIELSYQLIDGTGRDRQEAYVYAKNNPATHAAERRHPILFLHGLFGSKQNNRTISKYVCVLREGVKRFEYFFVFLVHYSEGKNQTRVFF
jgi:hypothetical protein